MNTKYIKLESLDFYLRSNYESLMDRLKKLKIDAKRNWGSMETDQMLHHLNMAIGGGLGAYSLPDNSTLITRNIIKPIILNLMRRFPLNSETPPALKVAERYDFETEKAQLIEVLDKAFNTKEDKDWTNHPYFGKLTRVQWGKLIMIHVNHHLQQFGV